MNVRKTLAAGITATAVALSGTTVAVAETDPENAPLTVDSTLVEETEEDVETSSDPKEIREWISVFTSVIGAMNTTYNFMDRYLLD